MTADGGAGGALDDATVLDAVRRMWERRDPVPGDLAERICFALQLEDLEVELLRMNDELVGARGEERVRTVTFSSASLSVMVSIGDDAGDEVRLDGWIDNGAGLHVELRAGGDTAREADADEDGRFALGGIPRGLVQLVFHPTQGAQTTLRLPVVTPAFQV